MRYEVDQSGRVEETNRDTVIGIASQKASYTCRVSAEVKRGLQESFRHRGRPKVFPIVSFAISVALTVQKSGLDVTHLTVDREYPGHEDLISGIIGEILGGGVLVNFSQIGKNSPAHEASYFTYIGEEREDCRLTFEEISGHVAQ